MTTTEKAVPPRTVGELRVAVSSNFRVPAVFLEAPDPAAATAWFAADQATERVLEWFELVRAATLPDAEQFLKDVEWFRRYVAAFRESGPGYGDTRPSSDASFAFLSWSGATAADALNLTLGDAALSLDRSEVEVASPREEKVFTVVGDDGEPCAITVGRILDQHARLDGATPLDDPLIEAFTLNAMNSFAERFRQLCEDLNPTQAERERTTLLLMLDRELEGFELRDRPRYDQETRTLTFLGQECRRYSRQPAENQAKILKAFEDAAWPRRLDDPLPIGPGDKRRRLNDTVRDLNAGINGPLRFKTDATGGVTWEETRAAT